MSFSLLATIRLDYMAGNYTFVTEIYENCGKQKDDQDFLVDYDRDLLSGEESSKNFEPVGFRDECECDQAQGNANPTPPVIIMTYDSKWTYSPFYP